MGHEKTGLLPRFEPFFGGTCELMGALLALASAVCYGVVDFAGGVLSRRAPFTAVTPFGQVGGLGFAVVAALLVPASFVHPADLCWGAVSGVGSSAAMGPVQLGSC